MTQIVGYWVLSNRVLSPSEAALTSATMPFVNAEFNFNSTSKKLRFKSTKSSKAGMEKEMGVIPVLDGLYFTLRYPCTVTLAEGTVNTSKLIVSSSFFVFFEVFGSRTGLRRTQEVVTRLRSTNHQPDVDGRCLLYWNLVSDTYSMPVDDADAIKPRTCSCSTKDVRDFAFGFFIDVLASCFHPSLDQCGGFPFDSSFQGLSDDVSNNT